MLGLKLLGTGVAAAGIVEVVAQAMPEVGLGPLLNASATAVLGILAFWLATKSIPAIVVAHTEAARCAVEKHSAEVKSVAEEHVKAVTALLDREAAHWKQQHADSARLSEVLLTLATNCAAVQQDRKPPT